MTTFSTRASAVAVILSSSLLLSVAPATAQSVTSADNGTKQGEIFSAPLPDAPGKKLSAAVIEYAPSGASPPHEHLGSVFVYVLSGAIRSQAGGDATPTIYHAGESFFEKPKAGHLISENASGTEAAKFLAIFVSEEGKPLTIALPAAKAAQ